MGAAYKKCAKVGPSCIIQPRQLERFVTDKKKAGACAGKPGSIALILWELHRQSAEVLEVSS